MRFKKRFVATAIPAALALAISVAFPVGAQTLTTLTASTATINTSIILKAQNRQALVDYAMAALTPGNRHYHDFLTVQQFRMQFAPSSAQIARVVRYLKSFGITIDQIYADHLDIAVTGTAAQLNAAFGTQLQDVTTQTTQRHFHRPAQNISLPGDVADLVLGVAGLDSQPDRLHPMSTRAQPSVLNRASGAGSVLGGYPDMVWPTTTTATGVPGEYTVGDVANFYQVNPLYQAGFSGRGQTIGILTFANFNPQDAEAYWSDIGLKVAPRRITTIMVDGGTPVQANAGDDETSLDVEQSGGLAPMAKIRVYVAPNNNQGGVDVYYAAVSDDVADTLSISWGEAEELYFAAANGGVDETGVMRETDQALLEAAVQGQSVFAAAGDSGAYDAYRDVPGVNAQLSVDYPASDPYITAAGGTTMKGLQQYGLPNGVTLNINVAQEQVWGWDYLEPLCSALGLDPVSCGITYGGGGGGVSSFWRLPYYQWFVAGTTRTQPKQTLTCETADACAAFGLTGTPPQDILTLPANFAGRNLPDISLNADPETGYVVVDCTDYPEPANPGCAATFFGGTSFVAPQLNGITALIDQSTASRVGFLNPTIYPFQAVLGYGSNKPFNDITAGDNWFYHGVHGYDNGAGIGTLNAANLSRTYVFLDSFGYRH